VSDEWTVFGNTLRFGDGLDDYAVFPGDMGSAQRLANEYNALAARLDLLEKEIEQETARRRRQQQEHARILEMCRERAERAETSAAARYDVLDRIASFSLDSTSRDMARSALADDAGSSLLAELAAARATYDKATKGATDGL